MPGPDPENKRRVNPMGDPGDDKPFPTQHDLGAMDPFEGSEHAPATRYLEANSVRIRPEGHRTGTDSLTDPTNAS